MVVSSMTVQEIHNEFLTDVNTLDARISHYYEKFKRKVLKTNHFPLRCFYEFRTNKNNLYIIILSALKRHDHKCPLVAKYGVYDSPEGKYVVALLPNTTLIFPPHFFKRYRERIVKDLSISNDNIIKLYLSKEWGLMINLIDENFKGIYHCFENDEADDKVNLVGITSQGYCFGIKQGDDCIIKTIISDDMLFENQKPLLDDLKQDYIEFLKDGYKTSLDDIRLIFTR
jgi:hypothetical protein